MEPRGIHIGHQLDYGHPNASVIESTLHELAHAAVLGLRVEHLNNIDAAVGHCIHALDRRGDGDRQAWIWQEIMALAVEGLALRHLKLPYHRQIVYGCNELDTVYDGPTFTRLVERAQKTKVAQRRLRKVLRWLDLLCEEGEQLAEEASDEDRRSRGIGSLWRKAARLRRIVRERRDRIERARIHEAETPLRQLPVAS